MPEKDLLLLYGKTLIDWKQYEVMRGMIIDENVLEKLDLDTHLYIE